MTQGDGPTIDVDPLMANVQHAHVFQYHGGKCFVELKQVDVGNAHPRAFQSAQRRGRRAGQHDGRVCADSGETANTRAGLQAQPFSCFQRTDQHAGGTVDDAR
ncbi:hypothetical protein D9M71_652040 [compost metagenome]